jgi:hypothetical protein
MARISCTSCYRYQVHGLNASTYVTFYQMMNNKGIWIEVFELISTEYFANIVCNRSHFLLCINCVLFIMHYLYILFWNYRDLDASPATRTEVIMQASKEFCAWPPLLGHAFLPFLINIYWQSNKKFLPNILINYTKVIVSNKQGFFVHSWWFCWNLHLCVFPCLFE